MAQPKRPLIGQILIEKHGLTPAQLEEGLHLQKEQGGKIGEILVRLKALTEDAVLEALSQQWQLPYRASLDPKEIDLPLSEKVPISFAKRYELLPFKRAGRVVQVAASNPLHLSPLDDLRLLLGEPIEVVAVPSRVVVSSINYVYERATAGAEQAISDLAEGESLSALAEELAEPEDLLDASDEAPMIRLVNSVLFQAVQQRASDIHFEPFEKEIAIRYRIDGVLYNILAPPKRLQSSLISRIKIMAGMNIAEKRLPQDGRIGLKIGGREIDIRVSDVPTAHGERLVLRLLDKTSILLNLEDIGLSPSGLATMDQLIQMAHGIILVTGPTGSGKTTTLYAGLSKINSPDKNIITIEDPIEYQLKGIGQIQVNPKIQLTFASGLRSILRQDPDVIMVGEIRDTETAEIAIQASLTGHLVFSTLHTNDSAGAITRLLDMGIEPFLVSSSVVAIVAQRLVRQICPECRVSYRPTPEELGKLGIKQAPPNLIFYRGKGCAHCINTGYRGRSGIYEIFVLDDEIRNLILSKVDSSRIKAKAVGKGMLTLREDGARRILSGMTTTEEVLRVTQEEIF
ncbi:MAG: type II secretion system ATPase GspE [Candidatus Manganitrophus sp. SB1]|nr:type II secretion system ATPase GspE [Candidatus Manganitrophus morganii]